MCTYVQIDRQIDRQHSAYVLTIDANTHLSFSVFLIIFAWCKEFLSCFVIFFADQNVTWKTFEKDKYTTPAMSTFFFIYFLLLSRVTSPLLFFFPARGRAKHFSCFTRIIVFFLKCPYQFAQLVLNIYLINIRANELLWNLKNLIIIL